MNTPSDTQRWTIAIKQPNAWAVIHGGKDVENRSATAIRAYRPAVGHRVYIHSSKGMTRAEYERAAEFMAKIGVRCPTPDDLARGGVIGSVLITGIEQAEADIKRAIRLSPRDPGTGFWHVDLGDAEINLGHFDVAIDEYHKARRA
jgi:hypothetical protein